MTELTPAHGAVNRYGAAGFAAACINMFVLEFITWVLMPWFIFVPYVLVPVVAFDALVSGVLISFSGRVAQIGRGMLIACISAPLTWCLAVATIIVAHAVGPF